MSGISRLVPSNDKPPSFPDALGHAIVAIRLATTTLARCSQEQNVVAPDASDVLERAMLITALVAQQFDSIAQLFISIQNMSRDDSAIKILAEMGGNLSACACKTANAAHEDLKKSGGIEENPDEISVREESSAGNSA